MHYPKIFLNPKKEASIAKKHHPWLFSHAIQGSEKIENASLCDVYLNDGKTFFGRGYYNSHSQISVRILTRDKNEEINQKFFEKRLQELHAIREKFINTKNTNAYRIVFGESDLMPGLILDKYDNVFVFQIHTAGMEKLKPLVVEAVKSVFTPKTIYERSDINVRLQEGLKDRPKSHIFGEKINGEIQIKENGILFWVDIVNGQKTGFFLDQRENRLAIQKYCKGKNALNCFSYTGGFSVYAALADATSTVNVEISEDAQKTARRNFELNKISLKNHEFVEADVFNYFDDCLKKKSFFDMIILDPPAFVKNKKTLKSGLSGYLHINEQAIRMLAEDGILVSCSCSSRVTDELFLKMLSLAGNRAKKTLRFIEIRSQPIDHPFNINFPEGKYLKCAICHLS